MKEMNEIRNELKSIRYYYARKSIFDRAESTVGSSSIIELVKLYNNAIRQAPPRLYDLYTSLYILNNTQESYANELGYSQQNVQLHHSKLLRFLQTQINS